MVLKYAYRAGRKPAGGKTPPLHSFLNPGRGTSQITRENSLRLFCGVHRRKSTSLRREATPYPTQLQTKNPGQTTGVFRVGTYFFFRITVWVCTLLPYLSVTMQYRRRPFALLLIFTE